LVTQAIRQFLDDDCTTMGAALAYYTTFSIAPLLLIIISIAGLVFGRQGCAAPDPDPDPGPHGTGPASQIGAMVRNAGEHGSTGVLGAALGIIALLVGATGAFTQL
jgi:membrane protein